MALNDCSLKFASNFERDRFKLFEVSEAVADDFVAGRMKLSLVGQTDDSGVLISQSETFDVSNCETSNTLLLLPPEHPEQEDTIRIIDTAVSCHFELNRKPPRLARLFELLSRNPLTETELNGEYLQSGDAQLFSLEDLQGLVQTSDVQLDQALSDLNATEYKGHWRLLHPDLLDALVADTLDRIEEHALPFESVSYLTCISLLEDLYEPQFVLHILRMLSSDSKVEHRNGERDEIFQLDEKIVCQRTAILVLRRNPRCPHDSFLAMWRDQAPALMDIDESMLRGLAVVDKESSARYWTYLPLEDLSSDVKQRFVQLFEIQSSWPREEILPFLRDLEQNGHSLDKLLLKFARSSKRMIDGAQQLVYTSRRNIRRK